MSDEIITEAAEEVVAVAAKPDYNTYEFKLTVLKNDLVNISVSSSNTSSSWLKMILVTIAGFLIIVGTYGQTFVQIYHQLMG